MVSDVAAGIPVMGFLEWRDGFGVVRRVCICIVEPTNTSYGNLINASAKRTAALQRAVAERERLDKEIAEVARRERLRLGQDLHDSLCQHLTGTARLKLKC